MLYEAALRFRIALPVHRCPAALVLRGTHLHRRPGPHPAEPEAVDAQAPGAAGLHFPGPPAPALHAYRQSARAGREAQGREGQGHASGRGPLPHGRPGDRGPLREVSASDVGWPEAAGGDRSCLHRQPAADPRRRADREPGPGPRPGDRPANLQGSEVQEQERHHGDARSLDPAVRGHDLRAHARHAHQA